MNIQNIDKMYYEVSDLLIDLATLSTEKGFHLDNDLEGGLFGLLLNEDYNEMLLLKNRIIVAIKKMNSGTFKISSKEDITLLEVA